MKQFLTNHWEIITYCTWCETIQFLPINNWLIFALLITPMGLYLWWRIRKVIKEKI